MQTLLQYTPPPKAQETREFNKINGTDAEITAAILLISACRGEVQWGSREEDNNKIDIIISSSHPWFKGERLLILVQVKSGLYFGEKIESGFKLKKISIDAAKRISHGICIIWVDRDNNGAYWAYVHRNTKNRTIKYGNNHNITPATLYDLARCMSKTSPTSVNYGITIKKYYGDITSRRKDIKKEYTLIKNIESPSLGSISLTRLGWRHMFRAGRRINNKLSSLELIPYLAKIMRQNPNKIAIADTCEWQNKEYIYRKTEFILKFSNIYISKKESKKDKLTVIARVIEEIRYPKDWVLNATLSQMVTRSVVLKSVYYKSTETG